MTTNCFYTVKNSEGLFLTEGRFVPFKEPIAPRAQRFKKIHSLLDRLAQIQGLDLSKIRIVRVTLYADGGHGWEVI